MSDTNSNLPKIETPIEIETPTISEPKHKAVGIPAIVSSMKHAFSEMGVWRSARTLTRMNHKNGFDCPSCAWPDPDDRRALAEFCENGAKAISDEATRKRVTPEFFAAHSIFELSEQSDFELGKHGRLTHPMVKRKNGTHYEPISWDDAFKLIARELNSLASPNEASFYTSGRTSNEAAFVYQLFARLFGTNNLPDCSNMCHESSGYALTEQIGVGKGTVKLEDLEHAECILIIGQNPGTNHPRMLSTLQKAVRNGSKIISINPLTEAGLTRFMNPQEVSGILGHGTPLASLFLNVRINGDVALAKGLLKTLLDIEAKRGRGSVVDHDFIAQHTIGYEALVKDLQATDWDEIVRESGISRAEIEKAAEMIADAKSVIACWAMGLTQHANGVGNIQMYTNILILGGHLGRRGAGACPVRGHSNVQGDRTMGIFEKMPKDFLDALAKEFNFSPPYEHGFDTVNTIRAMHEGKVKVFFGMGGNFMSATPDAEYVAEALRKCRLTVHVSTKPNRSHLVTGEQALILPCLGRSERDLQSSGEQFVTVEDSMSVVHSSRGNLSPGSPLLKSEIAIVCGLAKAVFASDRAKLHAVNWTALEGNYDLIRDHVEHIVPGFKDFNTRVRVPGGFYLPNAVRDKREFRTASGKAQFMVHPLTKSHLPKGRFCLMTIRSHDQFNTTIYGLNDRYRGVTQGRRVIFMNPEDMREFGFQQETKVDITSHFRGKTRHAREFMVVGYDIPTQCLAVYYPEGNVLVPVDSVAEHSNTPAYKSIEVSLERSSESR